MVDKAESALMWAVIFSFLAGAMFAFTMLAMGFWAVQIVGFTIVISLASMVALAVRRFDKVKPFIVDEIERKKKGKGR